MNFRAFLVLSAAASVSLGLAGLASNAAFAQNPPTQPGQSDPATRERNLQAAKSKYLSIMSTERVNITERIPINFPLPAYNSNVTRTSFINTTKGSPTATAGIITKDAPEAVFKWYQEKLRNAGWSSMAASPKLMEKLGKLGKVYMLDATKDTQAVKLSCTLDPATQGTTVSITWVKNR